ncbi:MAG: hypothetical protein KJ755_17220, partial [Alphaproteobacteria bacterium]|nr:hypothetical protein [Alphaproteobacteria bacterium]
MSNRSAVLILEGPWNLDESDRNRSSVLPFFEGMAKQFSDVDIVHSRYYDLHSFRSAFDELASHQYDNAIVYVAGHGDGSRVSGAKVVDILVKCNLGSWKANITGVVLGSCFSAGTQKQCLSGTINTMIQDSNIAWIAAYRCAAYWFTSTQVDLAIIHEMLQATSDSFESRDAICEQLAEAVSSFSPTAAVGHSGEACDRVSLQGGLAFFSQPRGKGQRSREVTADVWEQCDQLQLRIEDM